MTAYERLYEVFDRGSKIGIENLHEVDRELYRIQHFILSFEMDGLSGYLYNELPDLDGMRLTIKAMRRHGLGPLSTLLSESVELLAGYQTSLPVPTWGDVLRHFDPTDRLDELSKRITNLDDYGLANSTIS